MNTKNGIIGWTHTPFSYIRLIRKYSSLQQRLLLKVSDHIQGYMRDFFASPEAKSCKNPLPLLTEIQKEKGIEKVIVGYGELGVAPYNFNNAREELKKVLTLQVEHMVIKNGKIGSVNTNVFTRTESFMGDNFATLQINMEIVDDIFNMREGYVTHPSDIALLTKLAKMPMLYFLVKRGTKNWHKKSVRFNLHELKDGLGLIEYDTDGNVEKEKYERFPSFKKRIIEPSLKELDRLWEKGKIEKSFTVEYDYCGRKEMGEPTYIIFHVKKESEKTIVINDAPPVEETTKKLPEPTQTELQFSDEEPQYFTPYKERAPYIPEYEETQRANPTQKAQEYESNFITEYQKYVENAKRRWQDKWDSFVGHYEGRGKETLAQIKCNGISSVSSRNISVSYPDKVQKQLDKLKLTNEEWEDIASQLNKHKFVAYGILGIDRTEQGKNPAVVWRRK